MLKLNALNKMILLKQIASKVSIHANAHSSLLNDDKYKKLYLSTNFDCYYIIGTKLERCHVDRYIT